MSVRQRGNTLLTSQWRLEDYPAVYTMLAHHIGVAGGVVPASFRLVPASATAAAAAVGGAAAGGASHLKPVRGGGKRDAAAAASPSRFGTAASMGGSGGRGKGAADVSPAPASAAASAFASSAAASSLSYAGTTSGDVEGGVVEYSMDAAAALLGGKRMSSTAACKWARHTTHGIPIELTPEDMGPAVQTLLADADRWFAEYPHVVPKLVEWIQDYLARVGVSTDRPGSGIAEHADSSDSGGASQ